LRESLLISRALPAPVMERLARRFAVTTRATTLPMSEAEAAAALGEHDAILPTLGDAFTAHAFAAAGAPRARILANFGVGYNHIDVAAAAKAGVVVTNTPGAVTDATADIAMALILMSARRLGEGERLVRAGRWEGWHPTQLLGLHIGGKVLGVIGMGRIGRAIARRAHMGFGMDVVFFNRSKVEDPGVPARQLESIKAVMGTADVVAIAVPGGAATHHLIGRAELAAMRPHAHLVNISRGDVIDEPALIEALEEGRIAGAGLDVYEHEPEVPERLRRLENVVLLPHLGTNSDEVRTNMGMMAADNLEAFFEGRTPANAIQPAG